MRESFSPCPLEGPSSRILTGHAVGHLSSIVQKAELPTFQRFPGPLISQLVPGEGEEATDCWPEPCPHLLKRLERNEASGKEQVRLGPSHSPHHQAGDRMSH